MADLTPHHSDSDHPEVMDYPEHERTYNLFLGGAKWGTILCVALLIGMAFGFFAGGGLIGGFIVFVAVTALAWFIL